MREGSEYLIDREGEDALVYGGLIGSAVYVAGSYFLLPGVGQKFCLSKNYCAEILRFGKWIFISSVVYFLSLNFDKLYLGRVVGVYGIARAISDLLGNRPPAAHPSDGPAPLPRSTLFHRSSALPRKCEYAAVTLKSAANAEGSAINSYGRCVQ